MAEKNEAYIDFMCPECSNKLRASREHAGRKGKCPKCGNLVNIPKKAT